jgi:hypothetical protein
METWKQFRRYFLFQSQTTFNEKGREQPHLSQFWSALLTKTSLRRRKDQTWRKRKIEGIWIQRKEHLGTANCVIQVMCEIWFSAWSAGHGFMCTVPELHLSRSAITAMIARTSVHRTKDVRCSIVYPAAYLMA